jgi:hypothetical protein
MSFLKIAVLLDVQTEIPPGLDKLLAHVPVLTPSIETEKALKV